jgi:hypothetical protein
VAPVKRYFVENGQTMVEHPDGRVLPATTVGVSPDVAISQPGTAVPAASGQPQPLTAERQPRAQSPEYAAPTAVPERAYSPEPPAYDGGFSGGGYGYSRGGYSGRDTGDAGGVPRYADGTTHPSAFGDVRDLSGLGDRIRAANGQPPAIPGFDDREQVFVPGGAAAGPFDTSAASNRAWQADARLGGFSGGGGGGGGASSLYHQIKGRLSGALGGGSSYGSSGSYPSYASSTPAAPPEPRMRGLAKGMDPLQVASLGYRPTMLLPTLMPGVGGAEPLYQNLAALPAGQLGVLADRGYDGGPSDLVNAIGDFYVDAGVKNELPSFDSTFRNLTNPKSGGGIDQMFSGVKAKPGDQESYASPGYVYGAEPPSAADAAYLYAPYLDATLSLLPAETAMKYGSEGFGGYLMDQYGSKALKKPLGKGKPINTYVGRKLMR